MYRYLLPIQEVFPGCGITWGNVWETPHVWWRMYVNRIDELIAERGK